MERAARELSRDSSWILVQGEASMEVVGTALSFGSGCVGEGEFTVPEDRLKLAPVMRSIVQQKLRHCLEAGDLPAFKRYFNLQGVHLRGLEIEPLGGVLPSVSDPDPVSEFLRQNDFSRPSEADRAGWSPLHYAALAGDTTVLRGLLEQRANVNRRTPKDEPGLGFPFWMSALDFALFFKHHEATRLLLAARAHLEGGFFLAMNWAAQTDSAEGVQLLCAAGGRPLARNLIGTTALAIAAAHGAQSALEELVEQGRPDQLELSRHEDLRRDVSRMGRLVFGAKSLQHQIGKSSQFTGFAYHMHGSTPLMQAFRTGQHEGAAALIAAGASLEIRNCRKRRAVDFASEGVIPEFLERGLMGDPSESHRVTSLALAEEAVVSVSL